MKKERRSFRPLSPVKYAVLILLTVLMAAPVYVVAMMGTYKSERLFLGIPWLPGNYLAENVRTTLSHGFLRSVMNSAVVSIGAVLLTVFCASLCGYALARYEFRGKRLITMLLIVLLVIPTEISVVGYVREMRSLHLTGSYLSLILIWGANPFCAYFIHSFTVDAFPSEIMESARIDGCSDPGIFARLAFPMMRPGITTIVILIFLWSWNSYMLPLIIVNTDRRYTIPLFVSTLSSAFTRDYGAIMCALAMSILPMLLLFTIFSGSFMESISAGALKG
ncbi:carbohydrate ABC transporter permease [Lachnoclostridium sp. Marseille-P6806]|uniref:carbohydrate ABC transporter permease n=1 Tax=Lachnoclostridium sp. Marseille-P6806 TaxID=2364793 RepID=UPI0010320779|nr:carbohydrate ABC transporter permease [Lachnoclostridium sp. Marseille-P6806]